MRGAHRVQGQPGFGAAVRGFVRDRVRDLVGQVPVEDFAEVVALLGVGAHPAPHFLLQLQPEVLGHVLLGPPQEDGGRFGAFHVQRLVGGEQQDVAAAEFAFQFEGVVGVPAGPFDVLAHHGGEPRGWGAGLGQQVGRRYGAGPWPRTAPSYPHARACPGPGRRIRCPSRTRRCRTPRAATPSPR